MLWDQAGGFMVAVCKSCGADVKFGLQLLDPGPDLYLKK